MATVSASDWRNVMNLTDLTDAHAEYIIDLAIDTLNMLGAELSNMSGDVGSKSVSLTSKERGAVFNVSRVIYYSFYKELEAVGVGGITVTPTDLMGKPVVFQFIEKIAKRLEVKADIPFGVGEDTTGYE